MGGFVFQIGVGASFLNGEHLMGGIAFGGGGFRKKSEDGGVTPPPFIGKPEMVFVTSLDANCEFGDFSKYLQTMILGINIIFPKLP